jgi:hypothetical protein
MKRLLVSIVFALVVVFPAFAQDETPVVTETATAEVTPVVEPTLAPTEPAPVEPSPNSLFDSATLGELLLFMGLSALGGGGLLAIVLRFVERKDVQDRIENARETWSDDQKEFLFKFTDMFENTTDRIVNALRNVQDGKPNS